MFILSHGHRYVLQTKRIGYEKKKKIIEPISYRHERYIYKFLNGLVKFVTQSISIEA